MQVSAILGADPTAGAAAERKIFDRDEFLRILMAELENQNPLEPVESREFVGQLAQLQLLDTTTALNDGIQELLEAERLSRASAWLGLEVGGIADGGGPVEGRVDRVLLDGGRIRLGVGEALLAVANVKEITAPEP